MLISCVFTILMVMPLVQYFLYTILYVLLIQHTLNYFLTLIKFLSPNNIRHIIARVIELIAK